MFKIDNAQYLSKDISPKIITYPQNAVWAPKFIVLHNTAVPNIARRPHGFTAKHMEGLRGYYSGMGWKGGPHYFVDQNGVWVFNPIGLPGVHSPSWNKTAIGVEMLGDFEHDDFNTGDGAKIKNNAVELVASLSYFFSFDPETMKLHREDKKTTHNCPGKNVKKADFVNLVKEVMASKYPPVESKIVFYKKGQGHDPVGVVAGVVKNGVNYAKVSDVQAIVGFNNGKTGEVPVKDILGNKYTYSWDSNAKKLYCVEK